MKGVHYIAYPGLKVFSETKLFHLMRFNPIKCLEALAEIICTHYDISLQDFHSKSRNREFVMAKQMFCYIAKRQLYTGMTLKNIGKFIRPKYDHTSVMYGAESIQNLIDIKIITEEEINIIVIAVQDKLTVLFTIQN